GHLSDEPLYRELARGTSGAARLVRLLSLGERRHAALARSLAGRRRAHAEQGRRRDVRGRRGDGRALLAALATHRAPAPRPALLSRADVSGERARRIAVSHRTRRGAVPAAA